VTPTAPHGAATPAVNGQLKIRDATFRRIRAACAWAAPGLDLDEHAARVTLDVHQARHRPRHPYPKRATAPAGTTLDEASASGGEGGSV
jgi:hypothetical protein